MALEIGERLRQERERLGLSQGEFAEKAGVHRNTQVRYESGKREPDSDYLNRVQDLGIDAGFLLFGRRTDPISIYQLAVARFLPGLIDRAGFSGGAVIELLNLVAEDESASWGAGRYEAKAFDIKPLEDAFFEDSELLSSVFQGVKVAVHSLNLTVSYAKRAQLVGMLYRSFKASGKVDPAMIEEAVKLVAG